MYNRETGPTIGWMGGLANLPYIHAPTSAWRVAHLALMKHSLLSGRFSIQGIIHKRYCLYFLVTTLFMVSIVGHTINKEINTIVQ
jgi:hypothetical protein